MNRTMVAFHTIPPLLVGAIIYIVYRAHDIYFLVWLDIGQAAATPLDAILPSWLLYTLPDALWMYAFVVGLGAIWFGGTDTLERCLWLCAPLVVGLSWELGQLAGLIPGTFDVADLVAMAIAAIVAAWVLSRNGGYFNVE